MLKKEKGRTLITVGGVAFSVVLVLFLFGIYEGAKEGMVSYIRHIPAQIWVAQPNATNMARSTSFLHGGWKGELEKKEGVKEVTGILRVSANVHFLNLFEVQRLV